MKNSENNLRELVRAAQGGDQTALWEIIQQFSPLIKKARGKTILQERDDLEQELFEKIIRAIHSFDINTSVDLTHFRKSVHLFANLEKNQNNSNFVE
ncbi:helix-turn-helix domain-containing protein [Paenibacillus donghaensis]|uniref:helix-turn-helix domain-containing protein n=1 Tax=Paenibacillus donghaensis TaxID=414771 RepID=UPI0018840B1F|nr:helix-turn-helix domain-containing protein [Paenibacillus donghaensis]MBE9914226.1 helix-turn-helix domain-containing protein [Paenibacillus donghaensis]